eukprot:7904016-Karenia_brevis.AAC.1
MLQRKGFPQDKTVWADSWLGHSNHGPAEKLPTIHTWSHRFVVGPQQHGPAEKLSAGHTFGQVRGRSTATVVQRKSFPQHK